MNTTYTGTLSVSSVAAETSPVTREALALLPTRYGEFAMITYSGSGGKEHVALVVGRVDDGAAVLTRMHSECMTGDLFGSYRCDCGEQLHNSMLMLQAEKRGVLLYLRQEGRGIGLANKLRAYTLQDQGYDTVEANQMLGFLEDMREYPDAAGMLRDLGVQRVRLLTNNPAKTEALRNLGIEVAEQLPLQIPPNPHNLVYLRTKREKMGHILSLSDRAQDTACVYGGMPSAHE
jgi:3,4-dihydroxy 2-butanone 4-phosphate synthase/GTP cyclohydrolase II